MFENVTITKIKDVSLFDNSSFVEVALSVAELNGKLYGVCRRMNVSTATSGYESDILLKELDGDFNITSSEYICKGEDPRLFIFEDSLYFITWVYNKERRDLDMFLVNAVTKEIVLLENLSFKYNGKNWAPFVYNNELFFIYSLNPFLVLKYEKPNKVSICNAKLNENISNNIQNILYSSGIRAGSRGLVFDEGLLLFSRTHSPGPHIIHTTYINFKEQSVIHKNLEPERKTGVHDPYGFFKFKENYYISTTESDDLWGPQTKSFKNSIYLVEGLY
jgi:hypothetical protein